MKIAKVLIGETNLTTYNHLQPFIWEVYVDWGRLSTIKHMTCGCKQQDYYIVLIGGILMMVGWWFRRYAIEYVRYQPVWWNKGFWTLLRWAVWTWALMGLLGGNWELYNYCQTWWYNWGYVFCVFLLPRHGHQIYTVSMRTWWVTREFMGYLTLFLDKPKSRFQAWNIDSQWTFGWRDFIMKYVDLAWGVYDGNDPRCSPEVFHNETTLFSS